MTSPGDGEPWVQVLNCSSPAKWEIVRTQLSSMVIEESGRALPSPLVFWSLYQPDLGEGCYKFIYWFTAGVVWWCYVELCNSSHYFTIIIWPKAWKWRSLLISSQVLASIKAYMCTIPLIGVIMKSYINKGSFEWHSFPLSLYYVMATDTNISENGKSCFVKISGFIGLDWIWHVLNYIYDRGMILGMTGRGEQYWTDKSIDSSVSDF